MGFLPHHPKPQSAANQTSITTFLSASNHKPTNYLTTLCQCADYKIQLIPHLLMDDAHSLYLKFTTTHQLELFFFSKGKNSDPCFSSTIFIHFSFKSWRILWTLCPLTLHHLHQNHFRKSSQIQNHLMRMNHCLSHWNC